MNNLDWTGERLVTSIENEYFKFEHLHRYAIAKEAAQDKVVLDIACGEGYGSFIISKVAKYVYGVDIDNESVQHATQKYTLHSQNISFKTGSASAIPLDDHVIDLVVSFETIEHHDQHEEMMREIKRVLKPDGVLLISSPNKEIYHQIVPNNPYHVKELLLDEFENLLTRFFKNCYIYEQRFIAGSLITPLKKEAKSFQTFDGDYDEIKDKLEEKNYFNKAYYNLAICCDTTAVSIDFTSFFNGAGVVAKRNMENREKGRKEIMKTTSFKVGNWIVTKLSFLKKKNSKPSDHA